MFLGVHVYVEAEIVIIDQMNVASIVPVDAIYGVPIAVVNAWDYFKNGAKHFSSISHHFDFIFHHFFPSQLTILWNRIQNQKPTQHWQLKIDNFPILWEAWRAKRLKLFQVWKEVKKNSICMWYDVEWKWKILVMTG